MQTEFLSVVSGIYGGNYPPRRYDTRTHHKISGRNCHALRRITETEKRNHQNRKWNRRQQETQTCKLETGQTSKRREEEERSGEPDTGEKDNSKDQVKEVVHQSFPRVTVRRSSVPVSTALVEVGRPMNALLRSCLPSARVAEAPADAGAAGNLTQPMLGGVATTPSPSI